MDLLVHPPLDGVEVEIMWIPVHVELKGNEILDERAQFAELNGAVFKRKLPPVDLQGLARSILLRERQGKWNAADTGRFAHSILPQVSLLGLRVKGRTGNFENNVWSLYRPITYVYV
jgi:hypothetical protein